MSENTKCSRAYNFAVHFEMNKSNVTLSNPSEHHLLLRFGLRTWLGRAIPQTFTAWCNRILRIEES